MNLSPFDNAHTETLRSSRCVNRPQHRSKQCDAKAAAPPAIMAHLFRGKQAGIASDLSVGISSDVFMLDEVCLLSAPCTELVNDR